MLVSERAAAGRAARSEVRRSAHAGWRAPPDRADPVAVLERQARTRVPELVPIRHGRMAATPFAFFGGAAAVMAADLATTPVSGFHVQACGDAHLANFGAFAAPDRRLVFDLCDFDESLPAPWEWDVKRLGASFAIAGRERRFGRRERQDAVIAVVRSYREAMRAFAAQATLEVWYARLDVEAAIGEIEAADPGSVKRFGRDHAPFEDLVVSGAERGRLEDSMRQVIASYRATLPGDRQHLIDGYEFQRLARRVVGVGSVGTRALVILLTGPGADDPLFLQAKEAEASVLEPHAGPSRFRNHGRRVVEGQRLMQAAGDIFLGWCVATGIDGRNRDFYVRQLWDWKRAVEIERLSSRGLEVYGAVCGWTLARAHARSGDRCAIGAYLGGGDSFDRAVAAFAEAYADQNERDHAALVAAIDSGRLEAVGA
jgi:uncharacterized protein (DUF2252 family)